MNKTVSIFGGLGTKHSHYRHAIEVYKSNGYKTFFYENSIFDMFIHKRYTKIAKRAVKNDPSGNIIHTNSMGLLIGLNFLSNTSNNKLFVCEAGPFKPDTSVMINTFERMYKFKCPDLIHSNRNAICDKLGMPNDSNIEWHKKYNTDIQSIRNFVCLTSKNDKIIDTKYIDDIITKRNNDNKISKRYLFDTGTHWNISKTETQKYQDILQTHLDQIAKT
jgi:hypothetical protein